MREGMRRALCAV